MASAYKEGGNELFRQGRLEEAIIKYRLGLAQPDATVSLKSVLLMNIVLVGIKSEGSINCEIEARLLEDKLLFHTQHFPEGTLHKAYYRCSKYILGKTGDIEKSYRYLLQCMSSGGDGPEVKNLFRMLDNGSVNALRKYPFVKASWRSDEGTLINLSDGDTVSWNFGDDCPSCSEKTSEQGVTSVMFSCGHWSHSLCALVWFCNNKNNCLTCRTQLFLPDAFVY